MNLQTKENQRKFLDLSHINGMKYFEDGLKIIGKDGKTANEICQYVLNSGGKRLRAILTLCSGQIISKLNLDMIFSSIAIEIIHAASLVHDDIIDKAVMRRGNQTINSKMGNHLAVLTGDYLFAEAFNTLSKVKHPKVMDIIINSIKEMCDGEINQYRQKYNWNISEEKYMDRIYKKTGVLISTSCQAGSIAANAKVYEIEALKNYGKDIGYAFQIVDDMLDFIGDQTTMGKPIGNDLRQGEITLPVIYLINRYKSDDRLKIITNKNSNITNEDIDYIKQKIIDRGIVQKIFQRAQQLIESAKKEISIFPESQYKQVLINIADAVIDRNY